MVETTQVLRRELRLRDLVLFNICAIASLRWIAAAAHAGPGSLLLWVLAAVFFFVPSAIVVAQLSAKFPEVGGFYVWTKHAFGDGHAFLGSWLYFVSNILYLPSLVLSGVAMAAFAFGPAGHRFAEDRGLVLPATLVVLWMGFLANFLGLRIAKWISALGGTSLFLTVGVLTVLAVVVLWHNGSVTQFHLLPSARFETLNFWSQIAFAFVGLELAPILSGEIQNPERNVRRAAVISGIGCTLFYICGTASMLVLLRPGAIVPMTGLAQAGAAAALSIHVPWIETGFAVLIAFAFAGQLDTWIAGNTRLPYAIGLDRFLPAAFARLHPRWGTPYVSLLVQLVASTTFLLMAQLGETLRSAYDILVDMTVLATLLPFVYIFGAGLRFGGKLPSLSGLVVTVIAVALTLVPSGETASPMSFEIKVIGGSICLVLAGYFVFRRCRAERR